MKKSVFIILIATLAAFVMNAAALAAPPSAPAGARLPVGIYDESDLRDPLTKRSFVLLWLYWEAQDTYSKILDVNDDTDGLAEKYRKQMSAVKNQASKISAIVIKALDRKDLVQLENFSQFYKARAKCERVPLYYACRDIIEHVRMTMLRSVGDKNLAIFPFDSVDEFQKTYFPGYGEADPNSYYRKGKEISRETLRVYWKDCSETYHTDDTCTEEVTIGFLNTLEDDPNVTIVSESSPYEKMIEGVPTMVVKVVFIVTGTITVKSRKKYASVKIWFELWRNDVSIFATHSWYVCGKTYEIREEYTNETVFSGLTSSSGAPPSAPAAAK